MQNITQKVLLVLIGFLILTLVILSSNVFHLSFIVKFFYLAIVGFIYGVYIERTLKL